MRIHVKSAWYHRTWMDLWGLNMYTKMKNLTTNIPRNNAQVNENSFKKCKYISTYIRLFCNIAKWPWAFKYFYFPLHILYNVVDFSHQRSFFTRVHAVMCRSSISLTFQIIIYLPTCLHIYLLLICIILYIYYVMEI